MSVLAGPTLPTDFFYGCAAATLLALAIGWFILRQQRELIASRVSAELQAAHAIELRAEAERRAAAEMQNRRLPELEELLRFLQQENSLLQARQAGLDARLETEREAHAAQLNLLENARAELSDAFKALSADALRNNNQSFLELAGADLDRRQQAIDALVKPMRESLDKVDGKINELEAKRAGAYESLTAQVHSLIETQHVLRGETSNLVNALRSPNVRGRWGEIQLRRVVELAGMLNYCDFTEQTHIQTEDGRLRPDLIVRLPAGKTIVVDAKAPIEAYFESARSVDDGERLGHLRRHAGHIRAHIESLTRKAYWDQFPAAPEFVVLFLPGENFFSAALEQDPALIEHGVDRKIILATPTTLIALLRAVFHGWRQEALSRDAVIISELGRDLYRRLSTLGEHFARVGASLDNATKAYNQAVGSLETRVLVTARKFKELDAMSNEAAMPLLDPLEKAARVLQTEELQPQLPLPPPSA